ncbi:hypothetical protein A3Q56_06813 [Intoshia linei]|uniref:Cadherin domain-containing protein n=1 Tax=Intoshia linei TaxID=1819745 RepID=A0A177ATX1_9BILA|nr:hypothetical protein A3Q56_06813 [Intoshia linei]
MSGVENDENKLIKTYRNTNGIIYVNLDVLENETGMIADLTKYSEKSTCKLDRIRFRKTPKFLKFIDIDPCKIYIKSNYTLDYENDYKYGKIVIPVIILRKDDIYNYGTIIETLVFVILKIIDVNDEIPFFLNYKDPFVIKINNSDTSIRIVHHIIGRDDDDHSKLIYKFEYGDSDRFAIDSNSGIIENVMTSPFQQLVYNYGISIQDVASSSIQKSKVLKLKIVIVNNHKPLAMSLNNTSKYQFNIIEELPIGSEIANFKSLFNLNGQGLFEIFKVDTIINSPSIVTIPNVNNIDESQNFRINFTTGILSLNNIIDFENSSNSFHFQVKLSKILNSVTIFQSHFVNIQILDINDNTPTFTKQLYYVTMFEENNTNTTIIDISAVDNDSNVNAEITFSINNTDFYIISKNNIASIYSFNSIDYEMIRDDPKYNLNVTAVDSGTPSRTSSTLLIIYIINVNDNVPVFNSSNDFVYVDRNIKVNSIIYQVNATDADLDNITFSINLNSFYPYDRFQIDNVTGAVSIVQPYEDNIDEYILNIIVKDDGSCCGMSNTGISLSSTKMLGVRAIALTSTTSELLTTNTIAFKLTSSSSLSTIVSTNTNPLTTPPFPYTSNTTSKTTFKTTNVSTFSTVITTPATVSYSSTTTSHQNTSQNSTTPFISSSSSNPETSCTTQKAFTPTIPTSSFTTITHIVTNSIMNSMFIYSSTPLTSTSEKSSSTGFTSTTLSPSSNYSTTNIFTTSSFSNPETTLTITTTSTSIIPSLKSTTKSQVIILTTFEPTSIKSTRILSHSTQKCEIIKSNNKLEYAANTLKNLFKNFLRNYLINI